LPPYLGVEGKLCLRKDPAAAGVVGTVNRRFKVLWENRSLVFPQNRQFPQRISPRNSFTLLTENAPRKMPQVQPLGPGTRNASTNFV
jgi:hypothetical protein